MLLDKIVNLADLLFCICSRILNIHFRSQLPCCCHEYIPVTNPPLNNKRIHCKTDLNFLFTTVFLCIVFLCSCLRCFFGSAAIQHQCQQTQQDQQLPNHFPPAHIVYLNFSLNSLGVTPSYFLNILLK